MEKTTIRTDSSYKKVVEFVEIAMQELGGFSTKDVHKGKEIPLETHCHYFLQHKTT